MEFVGVSAARSIEYESEIIGAIEIVTRKAMQL